MAVSKFSFDSNVLAHYQSISVNLAVPLLFDNTFSLPHITLNTSLFYYYFL